ncbi:hypothetical protein BDV27DRAFT_164270 [Aspergillus caelatus]|uniref:Uncharacterized protein n=1 Tax=Aspergillus caelatus TaxID=61420 RepID=A0A5N6ZKG9_9EURO|nr:uncharacterized protein BDV27DRAFT_164270 [Aspergillus caelatus]KAE8357703.1 hypothetical protein BDV27DRAFT_164270 [Aspergillus caelatus]
MHEVTNHENGADDRLIWNSPYGPSQESDKWAESTHQKSLLALESNLRALSAANKVIRVEFGGDLLPVSVPEILEDPGRLNIVAVIMVAESATAAIGMETKLLRISPSYTSIPYYCAGPTTTLRANRNRVERETRCAGCYDLRSKINSRASQSQREHCLFAGINTEAAGALWPGTCLVVAQVNGLRDRRDLKMTFPSG